MIILISKIICLGFAVGVTVVETWTLMVESYKHYRFLKGWHSMKYMINFFLEPVSIILIKIFIILVLINYV